MKAKVFMPVPNEQTSMKAWRFSVLRVASRWHSPTAKVGTDVRLSVSGSFLKNWLGVRRCSKDPTRTSLMASL